ncbi:Maf family protein [Aquipuribacter nitratireducens]|uniref:Nucleoside triphosphate pyrophosphatase n=1 Tax=Aquipuribacter nitratireducens TaxID=650104 RepID=A0ABW0GLI9_9MICO
MTRLVLASRSPARLATLRSAGVDPLVRVSGVDEDAVVAAYGVDDPADVALLLARAKAEAVASVLVADGVDGEGVDGGTGVLVVGCDSVLDLDGLPFGKPGTAEVARERWRAMRGRTGVLRTGHWLVDLRDPDDGGSGASVGELASTVVRFADLADDEVDAYVATGEPLEVAGAFTIDGLGGAFVEGVDGDPHAVVGIGLPTLRRLVGQAGLPWHALWAAAGPAGTRD